MDELLNNAPCGFLVFADDGSIIEANQTLCDLLGYERAELGALYVEKIFTVAGRIFFQTHFFPLLKLHEKTEEIYLDLRSKTGETVPVLINAARRARGERVFNDCVIVAIRQRNRYEEEILGAKRQAEAATRAKDEFLSVVSHELRTPLNAILGWAQMLEARRLDAATVQNAIGVIARNARIQTRLIEDILDYARITTGKLKIEVGHVDVAQVAEAAVEVVAPAANAKNIRLQTIFDSAAYVAGDASRLQQVLWNLLQNAVKFTPRNGRVTTKIERANSSVEITVSDTGKGISADFLPYVFDRFEQAETGKTRRYSGLGLGLAIARHIVELHGGTIHADSAGENAGATFTVTLPVTAVAPPQTAEDKPRAHVLPISAPIETAPQLGGVRLLVVDDEPDARELLTTILEVHGACVTTAKNVAEAVEKFSDAPFDLIISDLEMPDEDGFSLIKKLNDFNETAPQKIPAVALTAHAHASERLKTLKAGFQMHLAKPVEPAELVAVVANITRLNR